MGVTPTLEGVEAALKVAAENPVAAPPEGRHRRAPRRGRRARLLPSRSSRKASDQQGKSTPAKILDLLGAAVATDVLLEQFRPRRCISARRNIPFPRDVAASTAILILLSVSDEGEVGVDSFPMPLSAELAPRKVASRRVAPSSVPDPSYGIRFDATSVTKGTVTRPCCSRSYEIIETLSSPGRST